MLKEIRKHPGWKGLREKDVEWLIDHLEMEARLHSMALLGFEQGYGEGLRYAARSLRVLLLSEAGAKRDLYDRPSG